MNLSIEERRLFEILDTCKSVSLDEIQSKIGSTRHSLIVRIKYLAAKIASDGYIIQNVAGIGRGVKAIYKMEKKF